MKQTREVRQGCPLSALLFIIALEPFLDSLRSHNLFQHGTSKRVVAYADDITLFVHKEDSEIMFSKLDSFCGATQFRINKSKCTIFCRTHIPGYEVNETTKELEIHISYSSQGEKLNTEKSSISSLTEKSTFVSSCLCSLSPS